MFTCIGCHRGLVSLNGPGGLSSHCPDCALDYLSVASLMSQSDSKLVMELWSNFAASCRQSLMRESSESCPRCNRTLYRVPLSYKSRAIPISGCVHCYMLIMPHDALARFQLENPSTKTKQREADRMKLHDNFRETHQRIWKDLREVLAKNYALRGQHILLIALGTWMIGRGNIKVDIGVAFALAFGVILIWKSSTSKKDQNLTRNDLSVKSVPAAPTRKSA